MAMHARSAHSDISVSTRRESAQPAMTEAQVIKFIRSVFSNIKPNSKGQKIGFVEIGPREAGGLQQHIMFVRQRELRQPNLRRLLEAKANDAYLNNNPIWICEVKETGEFVCVNGQHTLEMLIQGDYTDELPVVLDPVANETEVEQRYAVFDAGAARTQRDITRMLNIHLDLRDDDTSDQPKYASERQITRSAEAITWISTGLASNQTHWSKFERTDAVRNGWREEITTFWRLLGDRKDTRLPDLAQPIWQTFFDRISGGTFQAPFLVSFRAIPDQTERVMTDLIDLAKSNGILESSEENDDRWVSIKHLFDLIIADSSSYYGRKRSLLEWRVCLYLKHAIDASVNALRDEKIKVRDKNYNQTEDSWRLVTNDTIPRPQYTMADVDMAGAKARRRQSSIT